MKTIIFSIFTLFVHFQVNAQENERKQSGQQALTIGDDIKETREYFKNGNVKYIIPYRNDQIHGEMKWYKKDGRLRYSKNYIDGRPEGEQYYYFKRSTHIHTYTDGIKDKVFHVIHYNKDGSIREEYNNIFFEGYGQYKLNYKSGNVKIEGQYNGTKRNGVWSFFNKDGSLRKTKEYCNQFVFSFRQFVI